MTVTLRKTALLLLALLMLALPAQPALALGTPGRPAQATQSGGEKEALPAALRKLSTDLAGLLDPTLLPKGSTDAQLRQAMEANNQLSRGQTSSGVSAPLAYVYIRLRADAVLRDIEPMLSELCNADTDARLLAAKVTLPQLEALAALPQVLSINSVSPPTAYAGSHMTQGDAVLGADLLRAQCGVDGTGVKIGVISDGLDGINTATGYGDLPSNLVVLNDRNSGSEGVAMLEIVHDVAPGAQLYFHDCGTNMLAFNQAIDALVAAGCTIICDDIGWRDAPVFEDGVIAQHISDLIAQNNVLFVSAAGNAATSHYQGLFYDPDGNKRSDFSQGENPQYPDLYVRIPKNGMLSVMLQWDEKIRHSSKDPEISDYDLYVYNVATGATVAQSLRLQSETGEPIEVAYVPVNYAGEEYIAGIYVKADKAPTPRTVEVYAFPSRGSSMYTGFGDNSTPEDSIYGHPTVPGVLACGAIGVTTPDQAESFSSQGPATMLTGARQKPDVCGADGVEVSGAGGFGSPFYGTSAAAPHVAAIAALLKQQFPDATPAELALKIKQSTVDLGLPGYDAVYGYGRINAAADIAGYYRVSFNSMGGSTVPAVTAAENSTIARPADPTRTGFVFAGWFREETYATAWNFAADTVTATTTLYAKWTPATYTITFNSQGGSTVAPKTAQYNNVITAPAAPTRAGYTFSGWYKEAACTNAWNFATDKVTKNTVLYAKWTVAVTAPAAPVSVKAAALDYQTIRVSWAAVSGGAAGYEVYRAATATGAYSLAKTLTTTSFTDTARTTGAACYYKVRAYRLSGSTRLYSGYSAVVSATPVLAVPGAFKAVSAGYNSIRLSWSAVPGATGYELYQSTAAAGTYTKICTAAAGSVTAYTNSALSTGKAYYYKVRALRKQSTSTAVSAYSPVASAKPTLSAPTALTGRSASYCSVSLSWGAAPGASGYQVVRATAQAGPFQQVATSTSASCVNAGLTTNKAYYYMVRAYRKVGSSVFYSAYTKATAATPVLGIPTSVKAVKSRTGTISVSWAKVTGATKYEVYRATAQAGPYALVASPAATTAATLTWSNSGLKTGTTYYYKVRACRIVGSAKYYSGYCNPVYTKA